jgi:ankyrin repeat protein
MELPERLPENGLDDVKNSRVYGGFAIHDVVVRGDREAVMRLLDEFPAQVSKLGNGGASPLHCAALTDHAQHMADLLVSRGARVDCVDDFGLTPLHRMVQGNRIYGATSLLAHGAPANQPTRDTLNTPLHLAAKLGLSEIAVLLLAHGANQALKNSSNQRPGDLGLSPELLDGESATPKASGAEGPSSA